MSPTLGPDSPLRGLGAPSRRNSRPEADHEFSSVIPAYVSAGFTVNKTSARVHAKGVTPGIPDLHLQHVYLGFEMWHETKVLDEKGRCRHRQTQGQYAFEERCQATRTIYVLGDDEAAWDFLVWLGMAGRVGPWARQVTAREHWPKGVNMRMLAAEWYTTGFHRMAHERFGWEMALASKASKPLRSFRRDQARARKKNGGNP